MLTAGGVPIRCGANLLVILKLLRDEGAMPRCVISENTGMAYDATYNTVRALLRYELVETCPPDPKNLERLQELDKSDWVWRGPKDRSFWYRITSDGRQCILNSDAWIAEQSKVEKRQ